MIMGSISVSVDGSFYRSGTSRGGALIEALFVMQRSAHLRMHIKIIKTGTIPDRLHPSLDITHEQIIFIIPMISVYRIHYFGAS